MIRHPAKRLTPEKVTLRAASLVKACDASDGGADGNREPPRSLLVRAGDARVLACSHEAAHR